MNWNKYNLTKVIIALLLIINIATLSIIWIYIINDKKNPYEDFPPPPKDPGELMQKEFGFNDKQIKEFEALKKELFSDSDVLFKSLDSLQIILVNELYKSVPNQKETDSILTVISSLHQKLEAARFNHFKKVLSICNAEQKEKFKPVLLQMFSKKPPVHRKGGDRPPKPGDIPPPLMF